MKYIKGFEGLYSITREGNVYSHKYKKFLKTYLSSDKIKYPCVGLYKDGKEKGYRVHRLVALTFLDNPNNFSEIDHIDRDRSNYNVKNLRWVSRSQNERNKGKIVRKGLKPSKYKGVSWSITRNKWIVFIVVDGIQKNMGGFLDEVEAAKRYNELAKEQFGEFAYINTFDK